MTTGNTIQTICVCGAGTMGHGIAQTAARSGFRVLLYDLDETILQKARTQIELSTESLVKKNKMQPGERDDALQRLQYINDVNECRADLIIEAIIEKKEAKISLFNQLAGFNSTETIFASNTSSLSITSIAEQCSHPERVAGIHFFNPAPIMKLVEVVRTKYNQVGMIETLIVVAKQMGKTPVLCQDAPGFIVNHVARPYYLEALRLVEKGFADFETVDALMESIGFKMGPFKLMDLIGNDVNYAVSKSVYEAMGEPERLKPSPIQKQKIEQGELGRKTGSGYYRYS